MADVSNDAYHSTVTVQANDFSNSVLSRKIPCGRCVVENDDWFAVLAIRIREEPSPQQRNLDRPEVVRGNLVQVDIRVPGQLAAWNPEIDRPQVAAKRQSAAKKRCDLDTGNCADT